MWTVGKEVLQEVLRVRSAFSRGRARYDLFRRRGGGCGGGGDVCVDTVRVFEPLFTLFASPETGQKGLVGLRSTGEP